MKGPGRPQKGKEDEDEDEEQRNKIKEKTIIQFARVCIVRSMNGIKINFLLVTYRLSSNASFLTFATDRTRSVSFES